MLTPPPTPDTRKPDPCQISFSEADGELKKTVREELEKKGIKTDALIVKPLVGDTSSVLVSVVTGRARITDAPLQRTFWAISYSKEKAGKPLVQIRKDTPRIYNVGGSQTPSYDRIEQVAADAFFRSAACTQELKQREERARFRRK